jgi:hypothetical protein
LFGNTALSWMAGSQSLAALRAAGAGHGDVVVMTKKSGRATTWVMRALFLCLTLPVLLLAGCDAITRQNADSFEAAGVPMAQYDSDEQSCRMQAADYVAYDVRGMSGTGYDQNRAYNAVYSRCMTGHGYKPRPYIKNLLPG